jgi:hypothetical protein
MSKRPWVLVSYSADETARCLLLQTRSLAAAHEAIARNASVLDKPKRDVSDIMLLWMARGIQYREKCRTGTALRRAASTAYGKADIETAVRRLPARLARKRWQNFLINFRSGYIAVYNIVRTFLADVKLSVPSKIVASWSLSAV